MSFDAGAIVFKIQSAGAQLLQRDLAQADASFKKVGQSAAAAKPPIEGVGNATEQAGKKAASAKAPLDAQAKSTKTVGDASEKASQQQAKQKVTSDQQTAAARGLSTALLAAGLAVGAVVGLSVVKFAQFDQAMSNTSAAIMATSSEQKELAASALDAGAKTAYSATEAANAEEELAKAGLSVSEIIGGSLNGALSLAAAGQLQVARSAEIMATTLKQFNLTGADSSHVADLLSAGAGKAQGSVDDLAEALQYVGPVASGLGISVEETVGVLAEFASQGQIGQRAGTGLRGVLMSLTAPSTAASKTMAEYGINIFDSAGNMKSLATIAQILHEKLGGLTEAERSAALGRIFGNEQITAARVLYSKGAQDVIDWTDAVNDSGYAAEQAAKRQDNLAGDIEKLGGSFDTAFIQTGSGANDVLRDMVQWVTSLVDLYGDLPAPVQQTGLVVGIAAAALLLFYGGTVKAAVGLTELKAKAELLGISLKSTAVTASLAGLALAGVITIVTLLAQRQAEAEQQAKSYADTLDQATGAITDSTRKQVADALTAQKSWLWLSQGSAADAAKKFGISLKTAADAAEGNSKALARMSDVMKAGSGDTDAAQRLADKYHLSLAEVSSASSVLASTIQDQNDRLGMGKKLWSDTKAITDENTSSTKSAAEAYQDAAQQVDDMTSSLSDLIDTVNEANGVGQDAISKNLDYKDALAKVDEQIKSVGKAWGTGTQAGRDNQQMLVDLAKRSQDAAKAQFDLDHNTDTYQATLEAGRQALIDRAIAMGATKDQADDLADAIYNIPSKTEWKMIADTSQAAWTISDFMKRYGRLAGTIVYRSQMPDLNGSVSGSGRMGTFKDGGIVKAYADGGENHVAQIARAGEWRVWAEPETDGETYIPWAASKRARSTQILATTASAFGYDLVPSGAPRFADGASPTTTAPPVTAKRDSQARVQVTIVNPVVRDLQQDAWDAAQIVGSADV